MTRPARIWQPNRHTGGPDGAGQVAADGRSDGVPVTASVSAERRLGAYVVLVATGAVLALVTGRAGFVAVAAPAALLLAWGARAGRAPGVLVSVVDPPARVLEGDRWELELELVWAGPAEVDVVHVGLGGHRQVGPSGRVVAGDGGGRLRLGVEAERWGRHRLGQVAVRARRPGGFLVHDLVVDLPGTVRVLPAAARLDALLHPARPRAAAGAHPAPTRGPGTDFADLRPYVPGDRLRDLSWSATARSDAPWIVVHHPERTGTVVLVLDGFVEAGLPDGTLDRAARVVWSLAGHHLRNGDRVGLLTAAPSPRWLPPVAGRRARWQVLDALLLARTTADVGGRRGRSARAAHGVASDVTVPADAFVVGVSPLQSDAFVATVVHHRRLGRPTAVVAVETADLLPPPGDEVERAARRLWALDVEVRRATLSRAGVRSLLVADDVTPAVRSLSHLRHRTTAVPVRPVPA
ncbi:MAG TPA: DUF58 domain-containing protein [Acidimicrobiales bacterium]|nr:DUF58 domain-containing protein [Acidimicrobiales bacterium]